MTEVTREPTVPLTEKALIPKNKKAKSSSKTTINTRNLAARLDMSNLALSKFFCNLTRFIPLKASLNSISFNSSIINFADSFLSSLEIPRIFTSENSSRSW